MAKPLSGRRWFEALGRRHKSLGIRYLLQRQAMHSWPMWARRAYCRGRLYQSLNLARQEQLP